MLGPEDSEVFSFLLFFLGIKPCLLEFVVGYGSFQSMGDELDTLFRFRYLVRRRRLTQLYQRSGRVKQFDRLSRERTLGEITTRRVHGKLECLWRIGHLVELLEPALASL